MYPKYSELTKEEKAVVNNGCGPVWMPQKIKELLFAWMFHAQCGRHDWGYTVGGNELRRLECDLKFGRAMMKDAFRNLLFAVVGTILAPTYLIIVLLFGWTSFRYGKPLTKRGAIIHAHSRK